MTIRCCLAGVAVILAVSLASCITQPEAPPPKAPIIRDMQYWRGSREESPGPYLCEKPAATNVTVVCDRWPDCSDLRQFGLDAIRLSGAKTEHEKCLAVWRWVRRCTMCTNGTPPIENFANPKQSEFNGGYILDSMKILNVYGAHWCAGLSQTVECVWRALGYPAEKVNFHGHTGVDCFYRDFDGFDRWHIFDVDTGGFVLDRTNQRLLTLDELTGDFFTDWMFGWIHGQHLSMSTHRTDLSFRLGEGLERAWSNWNQPYENNVGKMAQWVGGGDGEKHASIEKVEHGPYPYAFGNGRWTYKPDLLNPDWTNGLAARPEGLAVGKFTPSQAANPGTAVWRFRTPYIVSDANVHLKFVRKTAADVVRLHLSVDDGATWKQLWECPADAVGSQNLVVPICEKFAMTQPAGRKRKVFAPPDGFNSPFGRYHYRLKLELLAKNAPADCRVEGMEFITTVQQNFYSLPQLQPGKNNITVTGDLAKGAALKVTYVWDDPAGKDRRNVTVVEQTPFTYEIVAAGRLWDDCVCKSITVEAVASAGKGNRTEARETPGEYAELPPMRPVEQTRECMLIRQDSGKLPSGEQLIADLDVPAKTLPALYGLIERREPKAFDAIKKIVYEVQPPVKFDDPMMGVKEVSLAALYAVGGEKAKPALLDVLSEPSHSKWQTGKGFNGTWTGGTAVIGYIAAEAGWRDFVPALAKAIQTEGIHLEAARGLLRSLGRLGDPRGAEAIRLFLRDGADLDTVYAAALAAGQVGDRGSIPQLRKFLACGYPPAMLSSARALGMLGDKASSPILRKWLTRTDEDFRGAAAEALGAMGDKDSVSALEAALAAEPFPWVREKIANALGKH